MLGIFTSLFVIFAASVIIVKGADLVRYESAEAQSQAVLDDTPGAPDADPGKNSRIGVELSHMLDWTARDGAKSRAWRMIGLLENARDNQDGAISSLVSGVKITPGRGRYWLNIANALWLQDEPIEKVLPALRMSFFVEPHELDTMLPRLVFMLQIIEFLPRDQKDLIVSQLIEAGEHLHKTPNFVETLKSELASQPKSVQDEIKAAIRAKGLKNQPWTQLLGL